MKIGIPSILGHLGGSSESQATLLNFPCTCSFNAATVWIWLKRFHLFVASHSEASWHPAQNHENETALEVDPLNLLDFALWGRHQLQLGNRQMHGPFPSSCLQLCPQISRPIADHDSHMGWIVMSWIVSLILHNVAPTENNKGVWSLSLRGTLLKKLPLFKQKKIAEVCL